MHGVVPARRFASPSRAFLARARRHFLRSHSHRPPPRRHLSPQLACESDEGDRRDALIHQLMKVTRGDPAGAMHFKPFAQWELHDGSCDGSASDESVKTEALHSPSGTQCLPFSARARTRAAALLLTGVGEGRARGGWLQRGAGGEQGEGTPVCPCRCSRAPVPCTTSAANTAFARLTLLPLPPTPSRHSRSGARCRRPHRRRSLPRLLHQRRRAASGCRRAEAGSEAARRGDDCRAQRRCGGDHRRHGSHSLRHGLHTDGTQQRRARCGRRRLVCHLRRQRRRRRSCERERRGSKRHGGRWRHRGAESGGHGRAIAAADALQQQAVRRTRRRLLGICALASAPWHLRLGARARASVGRVRRARWPLSGQPLCEGGERAQWRAADSVLVCVSEERRAYGTARGGDTCARRWQRGLVRQGLVPSRRKRRRRRNVPMARMHAPRECDW